MNYIKKKAYHDKYNLYKKGMLKVVNGKTVEGDRIYILLDKYISSYKSLKPNNKHIFDKNHDIVFQYIDLIKNQKKLPTTIPEEFIDSNILKISSSKFRISIDEKMYFRDICLSLIGYPLLTTTFIDNLAEYLRGKKVLEIMSGCGSLSYFLEEKGIYCTTTDNNSWENRWDIMWKKPIKMDAVKAIKKYGKDIDYILMSWPYMDDTAFRCLNTMRKVSPNIRMLYIGEDIGGCTANDEFFEIADMTHLHNLGLKSHYGIHDQIFEVK